jgi:hypothetical protein
LLLYQFLKSDDILLCLNQLLPHPLLPLFTDPGDFLLLLLLGLALGFGLAHHPRGLGKQIALIFEFGPFLHGFNLVQAFNFLLRGEQFEVGD